MATVFRHYGVDPWVLGALPLGFALEFFLGRWGRYFDLVPRIGWMVDRAERGLRVAVARRGGGPGLEVRAGWVLLIVVVGLVGGMAWLAVELLNLVGGPTLLVGQAVLIAGGMGLGRLGHEVSQASKATEIESARRAASKFIGLGVNRLDRGQINQAGLICLGDRSVYRVVAPLLWFAMAGPAGVWSYKALDTICGKLGGPGERYRHLGRPAIQVGWLANYLPSRLTWLLHALAAALLGEDGASSLRSGRWQGAGISETPGAWGVASLLAALEVPNDPGLAARVVDARTVRRGVRVIQLAGLHALALAWVFRIIVFGD